MRKPFQPRRLGPVVLDAAQFPDVDVRVRADNPIADFTLESGHQRERDDQRHDADRDAKGGYERDHRDKGLFAFGQQVPQSDVQLEREIHSRINFRVGAELARPARIRACSARQNSPLTFEKCCALLRVQPCDLIVEISLSKRGSPRNRSNSGSIRARAAVNKPRPAIARSRNASAGSASPRSAWTAAA